MTLPTVTVTGTFAGLDGLPARGSIVFRLATPLLDANDRVIVAANTINVALDNRGKFAVDLVPSDASGLVPSPVPYQVTERIGGVRKYSLFIPSGGSIVDLADIAPTPTPGGALVLDGGGPSSNNPTTTYDGGTP